MNELAEVREEWRDDTPIGRVAGEIDASNATMIGIRLRALVANHAFGLVVDLTATTYIDSAGINCRSCSATSCAHASSSCAWSSARRRRSPACSPSRGSTAPTSCAPRSTTRWPDRKLAGNPHNRGGLNAVLFSREAPPRPA